MAKTERDCFLANLLALVESEGIGCVTAMAEHFELNRVTVSRKIHGRAPIDLEEAERFAGYFGYNLSEILVSPRKFQKSLAKA